MPLPSQPRSRNSSSLSQGVPNDSSDPTGAFYIYTVNVSDGLGGFWYFPQVGQDRNAVIFTANFFDSLDNFIDARMFTVAKSLLYSGPSQTIIPTKLFTNLVGTSSAPIVLDTNPNTYLVAADSGINVNTVTIYTLTNSAANPPTLNVQILTISRCRPIRSLPMLPNPARALSSIPLTLVL